MKNCQGRIIKKMFNFVKEIPRYFTVLPASELEEK